MSTIYCDRCNYEWDLKDTVIEELILNEAEGTKMRFFQCPECQKEYIVDVTDKELRKQISVYKKMQRKYRKMYEAGESEGRLRNYLGKIESVNKALHVREAELKRKWTSGE